MHIKFFRENKFFRELYLQLFSYRWGEKTVERVEPYLKRSKKVLDIGSGKCVPCFLLRRKGFDVTPLDVENLSFIPAVQTILYDGKNIPFKENEFDAALLITVLHHTNNPEEILQEAKRIAKRIIIIEDIYTNMFQKYLTYAVDSLVNLEFIGHPHSNKTDEGWKKTFAELGLNVRDVRYDNVFLFFKQATYHVEKETSEMEYDL